MDAELALVMRVAPTRKLFVGMEIIANMTSSRTLANAPLIEVIVEVQWELEGAKGSDRPYDPRWFQLLSELEPVFSEHLPQVERMQPEGISLPLEVLGRTPLRRFRPPGGGWPLAQLGQGLMTVNAVPPYDGWESVCAVLGDLLTRALEASPALGEVRLELLKLQYRDAFGARHGVANVSSFFAEHLPLANSLPLDKFTKCSVVDSAAARIDLVGKLPVLNGSVVVRGSLGKAAISAEPEDVAIVDFIVQGRPVGDSMDHSAIMQWFDQAHQVAWELFNQLVPPSLMAKLREKSP